MNWPHHDADGQDRNAARIDMSIEQKARQLHGNLVTHPSFVIEKETYTSGQAARLLCIPARTLRRYLSIGRIEGNQNPITQTWHINSAALVDFIEEQGGDVVIRPNEITILLVDGRPVVADLLKRVVEHARAGIVVKEFQEVGDALIESGVYRPDLIVINTATPFYDGIGLLKLLRSNEHTQSIKILAITDNAESTNELRVYGATMILVKPFTYNDLAKKLGAVFPLHIQLPA